MKYKLCKVFLPIGILISVEDMFMTNCFKKLFLFKKFLFVILADALLSVGVPHSQKDDVRQIFQRLVYFFVLLQNKVVILHVARKNHVWQYLWLLCNNCIPDNMPFRLLLYEKVWIFYIAHHVTDITLGDLMWASVYEYLIVRNFF